jgi:hypothetical protein
MAVSDHPDFRALDLFFRIVEQGVADLVDGERFFEMLAEDVVFKYVITVPGYPRRVQGRDAIAELLVAVCTDDRAAEIELHHRVARGVD